MALSIPVSIESNLHRVNDMAIYGKSAKEYTKDELIALIIWMIDGKQKTMNEHTRQMSVLMGLRRK